MAGFKFCWIGQDFLYPLEALLKVAVISFQFGFGPCTARRKRILTAANTERLKKP